MMSAENAQPNQEQSSFEALAEWFTPLRFGVGLALALIAAFPDVVFGSGAFFYQDYGVLGYPVIHHHHHSFWSGDFVPLWNPFSNSGAPFMAQWGTMTLYPLSLFYLILPLPWSLGVFCLLHLWLGGMGMYFLAHRKVSHRFAATLAGLVFVFNGFTLSCLQWPNYMVALGWLPWIALTVDAACARGGRAIVVAAIVATLQMLSGVPEFIVLTWLIVVALQSIAALEKHDRSHMILAGRRLVCVIALAAGLSAAQLLPFFELLSLSQRHDDFAVEKWAMPWRGVGNFFVPLFHYAKTYTGAYFQSGQSLIATYYLGLGAMTLALFGAFRGRSRESKTLVGIVMLSVILAMGENGVLYGLFKDLFPRLGFVRYPIKFLMPLAFATPLLAAYGARWFMTRESQQERRDLCILAACWATTAVVIAGLVLSVRAYGFDYDQPEILKNAIWRAGFLGLFLVLLHHSRRPALRQSVTMLRCGLLIIIVVDVLTHMPRWNPRIAASEFRANIASEAQEFEPGGPGLGSSRIMIGTAAEALFLRSTIPDSTTDFRGKCLGFWSHLNLLDGIPKVNGSSTLQLREQAEVQDLIYKNENPEFDSSNLADFLAVSHVTSPKNPTEWIERATAAPWIAIDRTPVFLPREQILDTIADGKIDLTTDVILPVEASEAFSVEAPNAAQVTILSFDAHHIAIQTHSEKAAAVVIAQAHHPAWKARVNGESARIWRANHAFQAIAVPAGDNTIHLNFRDSQFRLGMAVTLASIILCCIVWRRRPPPPPKTSE